uniref:Ubiquitin carboxyl-terminal hydrolase MINDY n=1 Tax=Monopterus albus TaxID=43700 RepID=A0A3Q3KEA5_MONAL
MFGGTFHIFSYEWRKSSFQFREPNSEFSYVLETDRFQGGAQAIQMAVQARIIRHLLLSEVGQRDQEKVLAAALSDSLWLAGQEVSATVTLVTEDYCITPQLDYKLDNFTERLQLFTFNEREDVRRFILEHIHCFKEEGSHGVILFLYSLICSRTVDALLNLLLTGRGSPHVFNGMRYSQEDDLPLERRLQGVLARSDVGYLHWSREQQVGSMLKTPRFPVWLCCINGSFSVLFSLNRTLLSNWKVEQMFQLYYYHGQSSQKTPARLTVTHSHHWEVKSTDSGGDPETRYHPLEMTIRTKWAGATIDWNGTAPLY